MVPWVATLGRKYSEEELADLRQITSSSFGIDKFTCDECPARYTCEWAFDPYNTDDDCLAAK